MIKVGIDNLAIYTSRYAFGLTDLANARGTEPDKYTVGLGQLTMSVPPPGEDIVTMATNAAKQALIGYDVNDIEMLLFATESGIDQSKAAGIYVHDLLGLPPRCRVVELKQACYSGTAALQLALPYLRENPDKKILLIASDIARYGLKTAGESSQGAAAIAMVLATNPRVIAFEPEYGVVTENVMDFWRPNYLHEALVDGKYSSKLYLVMLEKSFGQYQAQSGRRFSDHAYFCYHSPVPRLVEKAHQHLLKITKQDVSEEISTQQYNPSLIYGRRIGNSYTASLYVGLASLLDNVADDLTHKRIGFYSYGSGCVAEYFSGVVQPGYQKALHTAYHAELLASRKMLTYQEYESFYTFSYAEDGSDQDIPTYETGSVHLSKLQNHKRIYQAKENLQKEINESPKKEFAPLIFSTVVDKKEEDDFVLKISAPGKLILSGEHSVVYGKPALAMAINRYVTATVTKERSQQILFDLSDLAHHGRFSLNALHHVKDKIKEKYHRFIRGEFSIREVLQKPFELAHFAMGILTESLDLSLPHGVKIQVQSDLAIGCGMGSSAATILSVMQAISTYMNINLPQDKLYQLALEAENMQHGYSSGLDLRVALNGGCILVQEQEVEKRVAPEMPMFLINTGSPISSTGQCVEKVAPHFSTNHLADEFAAVTKAMDSALRQRSWPNMREAIRQNHQLLIKIGVVPKKVQQFISEVEKLGGAAKICGAGAIAGEQAGAVLVSLDNSANVTALSSRFGYNVIPISCEARGVHAA